MEMNNPSGPSAQLPLHKGAFWIDFSHTIGFTAQENASLVQREVPRRGGGIAVPPSLLAQIEKMKSTLRCFAPPFGPLTGKACSTLWLKMCHRHIFFAHRKSWVQIYLS